MTMTEHQGNIATDQSSPAPSALSLDQLPQEIKDLIPRGEFAQYHLEKAKIALALKDFKSAKYEIEASFRHGSSQEARDLKAEIRRQSRG